VFDRFAMHVNALWGRGARRVGEVLSLLRSGECCSADELPDRNTLASGCLLDQVALGVINPHRDQHLPLPIL
jgi:hypothetical protein